MEATCIIRTSDNTVVDTISIDNQPIFIIIAPNGSYVYTSNASPGYATMSIIQTSDNTVVDTIIFNECRGIAVTPNGSYVYVNLSADDTVSVIQTSDNTVAGDPIPVGDGPWSVAVNPCGSNVYVANMNDNTVSVIGF